MSLRNPRYERFAYGLAEGKPAYQAYIDPGFAKVGAAQSASRLLKSQRAGIRERVAEILQEREQIDAAGTKLAIERTAITKEWVIERLRENVERAMQAQPVIDRAGNPTGSYVYNGAAANRALELLGKELGMFIERRENKIVNEFDSMSDEQIEAWLDEKAEARLRSCAGSIASASGRECAAAGSRSRASLTNSPMVRKGAAITAPLRTAPWNCSAKSWGCSSSGVKTRSSTLRAKRSHRRSRLDEKAEARMKIRHRLDRDRPRMRRGRAGAGVGGIGERAARSGERDE